MSADRAGAQDDRVSASSWCEVSADELARGFAAGEEGSLEETFRRWGTLVHSLARRLLEDQDAAEDVTQQVFVTAWRQREVFRPDRGSLAGWLVGITRHRIADARRARARDQRNLAAVLAQSDGQVEPPADRVVDRVLLAHEIEQLTPPRDQILRALYYEGRTCAEVATELSLPLGTVKSHARRALLVLRDRLKEVSDDAHRT